MHAHNLKLCFALVPIALVSACAGAPAPPATSPAEALTVASVAPNSAPYAAGPVAPSTATHEPPSPELVRRAHARIEAADKRRQLSTAMFQTGASSMLDVIEASRSWFISWRESGIRGPELVQAAEAYRNTMSRLLELQTERVHKGASNQADLASAEYGLAEAEFWLEEARSK